MDANGRPKPGRREVPGDMSRRRTGGSSIPARRTVVLDKHAPSLAPSHMLRRGVTDAGWPSMKAPRPILTAIVHADGRVPMMQLYFPGAAPRWILVPIQQPGDTMRAAESAAGRQLEAMTDSEADQLCAAAQQVEVSRPDDLQHAPSAWTAPADPATRSR